MKKLFSLLCLFFGASTLVAPSDELEAGVEKTGPAKAMESRDLETEVQELRGTVLDLKSKMQKADEAKALELKIKEAMSELKRCTENRINRGDKMVELNLSPALDNLNEKCTSDEAKSLSNKIQSIVVRAGSCIDLTEDANKVHRELGILPVMTEGGNMLETALDTASKSIWGLKGKIGTEANILRDCLKDCRPCDKSSIPQDQLMLTKRIVLTAISMLHVFENFVVAVQDESEAMRVLLELYELKRR